MQVLAQPSMVRDVGLSGRHRARRRGRSTDPVPSLLIGVALAVGACAGDADDLPVGAGSVDAGPTDLGGSRDLGASEDVGTSLDASLGDLGAVEQMSCDEACGTLGRLAVRQTEARFEGHPAVSDARCALDDASVPTCLETCRQIVDGYGQTFSPGCFSCLDAEGLEELNFTGRPPGPCRDACGDSGLFVRSMLTPIGRGLNCSGVGAGAADPGAPACREAEFRGSFGVFSRPESVERSEPAEVVQTAPDLVLRFGDGAEARLVDFGRVAPAPGIGPGDTLEAELVVQCRPYCVVDSVFLYDDRGLVFGHWNLTSARDHTLGPFQAAYEPAGCSLPADDCTGRLSLDLILRHQGPPQRVPAGEPTDVEGWTVTHASHLHGLRGCSHRGSGSSYGHAVRR